MCNKNVGDMETSLTVLENSFKFSKKNYFPLSVVKGFWIILFTNIDKCKLGQICRIGLQKCKMGYARGIGVVKRRRRRSH